VQQLVVDPGITAGVALAAAGVIAVSPITVPLPAVHLPQIQLTAGDGDITIDFVRHGQSTANAGNVISTQPPGPDLSDLGQQQARTIGQELFDQYGSNGVAGIYASDLVRTQETAAPFAELEHMDVQDLAGLNEIGAGIFNGFPQFGPATILYLLPALAWSLGFYSVPIPGSPDLNGAAFEDSFGSAVQTIYDNTANADGPTTDVAFSSSAAIMFWTLMNVDNPDLSLFLTHPLANTGQIVVDGRPGDWTLVSWAGQDVPQDPGLTTELFVDFRDLITAPQMAAYHIGQALLSGDPATISAAFQNGVDEVSTAITQFPSAVVDDVTDALGSGNLGDLHGLLGGLNLEALSGFVSQLSTQGLSGTLDALLGEILTTSL
jgi:broad specificity phosphatase PhoE